MILKVIFSTNNANVSINNQSHVNGWLHRCLGANNKYHDSYSEYAVSSIQGGKLVNDKLIFPKEAYILISSSDENFINTLMAGILRETDAEIKGLRFKTFEFLDYHVHDKFDKIVTLSPILLRDDNRKKIAIDNKDFIQLLEENCKKKLARCGITDDTFSLELRNPNRAKVKKIMVGETFNICSLLSLKIYGLPKTRKKLYNMGIGQSCGCGFGTIKIYE